MSDVERVAEELAKRLGLPREKVEEALKESRAAVPGAGAAPERNITIRICPTGRGAVRRLRNAFWALINREGRELGNVDEGASAENWRRMARALVERMNAEGVSEAPCRITLFYRWDVAEDGRRVFVPVRAHVEVFRKEAEFSVVPASEE